MARKVKYWIPEEMAWYSMMRRCYNPRVSNYINYGGRGIDVDEAWHNIDTFLADMGKRPSNYHSLDRIDNDKGYSKSNCRWATREEQCANRSRCYTKRHFGKLEIKGEGLLKYMY